MTDDQPHGRIDAMPNVSVFDSTKRRRVFERNGSNVSVLSVRATFLTGRYSHRTGVFQNQRPMVGGRPFHANGWESQSRPLA